MRLVARRQQVGGDVALGGDIGDDLDFFLDLGAQVFRDRVLEAPERLVFKPRDGQGGQGVVIGPRAEAAELLECFQWSGQADQAEVESELADVLTYAYLLADRLGVDPHEIMRQKLAVTEQKYPVEKARGRSTKHDRL